VVSDVIERARGRIGSTTLTLVVTEEPGEQRFIGEALILAALVYLAKRYVDGFLKGIGFDDMAQQHGAKARQLLDRIRHNQVDQKELESESTELQELLEFISLRSSEIAGREAGEAAVTDVLLEMGAVQAQAADAGRALTLSIFATQP
jgi:hypothetical protein